MERHLDIIYILNIFSSQFIGLINFLKTFELIFALTPTLMEYLAINLLEICARHTKQVINPKEVVNCQEPELLLLQNMSHLANTLNNRSLDCDIKPGSTYPLTLMVCIFKDY